MLLLLLMLLRLFLLLLLLLFFVVVSVGVFVDVAVEGIKRGVSNWITPREPSPSPSGRWYGYPIPSLRFMEMPQTRFWHCCRWGGGLDRPRPPSWFHIDFYY